MFKLFIIEFVFARIEAAIHLRNLLLLFPMSQNIFFFKEHLPLAMAAIIGHFDAIFIDLFQ